MVEKQEGEQTLTYNYTVEDRLQAVKEGNTILMAAIYDGNGDRAFTLRPSKNPPSDEPLMQMVKNPKTGDNIWVYVIFAVSAVIILIMVNSKNEKVRKVGIALLIVLVIAGSITIIAINREKKENSYSNGENKNSYREINEDMIFIPLGISNKDRNKYELTQYINDVTTQNTQVLMEYSNESGITAYSYGNERLTYETNGATYQYNYDGRGSVTNLLDNNNASVVQYNYKPFGETTKSGIKADELENTYQYNAESTDAITGLQYLRARYYDSEAGRFISQDTYLGDITDPLTRNLYLYTNNDPVNYVDPSGHFWNEISNWGKSVVNGVKNAWNTTVQTVKNVGNAISNTVSKAVSTAVSTVKNAVSSVTNAVTNTVKKFDNYIENKLNNFFNDMNYVSDTLFDRSTSNNPIYIDKSERNTYGAAWNSKVEKSREIENQIKLLRQQHTVEADKLADYLQENMKMLCDDSLIKLSNQDLTNAKTVDWIQIETQYSKWTGVVSEIGIEMIGSPLSMIYGVAHYVDGGFYEVGVEYFNENHIVPIRNSIQNSVPNKEAFIDGAKCGKILAKVIGAVMLLKSVSNITLAGPSVSEETILEMTFADGTAGIVSASSAAAVGIGIETTTGATVGSSVIANDMNIKDPNSVQKVQNTKESTGSGNSNNAEVGSSKANEWKRMTSKESKEAAQKLGYEKTNYRAKNGEPIYYNRKTKTYISQDIGSADGSGPHNGGVWKMAKSPEELNSKNTRMGTYDKNLNRIGD